MHAFVKRDFARECSSFERERRRDCLIPLDALTHAHRTQRLFVCHEKNRLSTQCSLICGFVEEMPGKLTKNRKIREGQRVRAKKVLASVDEVLTEYDGSRSAKDRITRLNITLNEKLVTLKALDDSILSAVEDGDIESEIEESENFRGKIPEALVKLQSCQVVHDQQENPQSQETHQQTKSNGNKSKLPKLT